MKRIYLLFVAVALAACSAEPVENELSGLDANLTGRKVKVQETENLMGFYAGQSGNLKGTLAVWNDCDNLYVEITPSGDAPENVEISFENALPELNNGGQFEDLAIDYTLEDTDNLLWTIPVSEFDTENDLFIFVKAWGDYAGSSLFGERKHQYTDFTFDFSLCLCEESFNYDKNEDGSYTFIYVPAEDMPGAELVFTFAQSVEVYGLTNDWEWKGQTMQTKMDLFACTSYSWDLTLIKKCGGNTPNNNVWTDFNVNDLSKKNANTPTISKSCSE